jgi:opacity protein-like surface antigen
MDYQGKGKNRRVPLALVIGIITVSLMVPGPRGKAWALKGTEPLEYIAGPIFAAIAIPAIAYAMWLNRPSQQGKAEKAIPGEFYVSVFGGGSLVNSANWDFREGIPGGPVTASRIKYQPGVVGGLKFGYFCNYFPWIGVEAETNVTRNTFRTQQVSLSHPVNGSTTATVPTMRDGILAWTLALHFVGRYGFLKDKEVPFGRLQPYVGIGPGLEVLYTKVDSAKEFSIEAQVGLRYMMLKNVSAFVEYKYSKVFDALMEDQVLIAGGQRFQKDANYDFDSHKIVVGVSYHF